MMQQSKSVSDPLVWLNRFPTLLFGSILRNSRFRHRPAFRAPDAGGSEVVAADEADADFESVAGF